MVTVTFFSKRNEEILGDNWLVAPVGQKVTPVSIRVASVGEEVPQSDKKLLH